MIRRIVLATAVAGLLFGAAALRETGGRLSLPLDDSFIYFQYARQAAAGHPFVYQPGDAPTTGATSIPWMLVLAAVSLMGFGGKAMIVPAMLLGGALLALTAVLAARTQRALAPRKPGSERPGDLPVLGVPLAGALVLLSGPLQWGAWSGMEIALTAAAVAWAGLEWVRAGGRPAARPAIAAACLALVRPEGMLLALWVPVLWAAGALLRAWPARTMAWALLPAAAVLVLPLVNLLVTGDPRSTGFLAKSLLAQPGADAVSVARVALLRAAGLGASLLAGRAPLPDGLGLYAYDSETAGLFVPPGAGLLFAIGVLPAVARELRDRRPGPGLLGVAWIGTILLATSLIAEPDAHFGRYQMPLLPPFLVWVAMGVGRVERVLRDVRAGWQRLADGVRAWLVVAGGISVLFFAGAFGDDAADIDRMQIRLGEALATAMQPGEIVAINDAGAIAYVSGRPTLDLVGLTTPGLAGRWTDGSGALWESLEALPPARRPTWFCIFPNWFDLDGLGLLRRVGGVRLLAPSIVDAEKVLYRADWSLAGSGDAPAYPGGGTGRVVDRLDVADVASERAHAWRLVHGERGAAPGAFVRRAPLVALDAPEGAPARDVVEGGRTVFDAAGLELARDPVHPATVLVRTVSGLAARVLVTVDAGPAREIVIDPPGSGAFVDVPIATLAPGTGRAHVRLARPGGAVEGSPLVLAHVFAVVPEGSGG